MARTLLIGNARTTWREWLRDNRRGEELLCLDPADPVQLTPGLLNLFGEHHPKLTRFYGSIDVQRQPHVVMAFLAEALSVASDDLIIQLFDYRPSPLMRQCTLLAAQLIRPDRILIAAGTEIDQAGFPIGPEEVEIEKALPVMVQHAQRKAQWLKLLETCESHTVDLRKVSIEGARVGSGTTLDEGQRKKAGLEGAVHVSVIGTSLHVISDLEVDDNVVSSALDFTGCSKAFFTEPGMYRNLYCSFANQMGVDFGYGIIVDIDWPSMRAKVLSTAVPPAPVRILRLGALRVDPEGREFGEVRPWQV